MVNLEIPVFNDSCAATAIIHGAGRIELNRQGSYPEGGLTPIPANIPNTFQHGATPLSVMIRPRGPPPRTSGMPDFVYTDKEFRVMRQSVIDFKMSGTLKSERGDGFVFGMLTIESDGSLVVDKRCHDLVELAAPFRCVFHRAFDLLTSGDDLTQPSTSRIKTALDALLNYGFAGVLTSGGISEGGSAIRNLDCLAEVVRIAAGRIEIIVGGGLRSSNVGKIMGRLGNPEGVWYHSSCLAASSDGLVDAEEVKRLVELVAV